MNKMLHAGKLNNGIGAINELFCSKDKDWEYQDEWRLIGDAGAHCKLLKIKAIYLGFKVGCYNENRMKKHAKTYGFDLYKMDSPKGKKKITYTKIV